MKIFYTGQINIIYNKIRTQTIAQLLVTNLVCLDSSHLSLDWSPPRGQ